MKKALSILLALALTLLPLTAAAAEPSPNPPQVGDVVNGFELIEARDYALMNGTIYRFTHQRTGAELFYLANDSTNRAFCMGFRTQAIDNTGLPHVFEHATMDGSEKYPSKELWFNLDNGSYQTYMNAHTEQNVTYYPIASLSEAQLLKLADFYVDSCLHPMVLSDESIYREEAWRYRLESKDAPLTLEGTVYSEMLGAHTLERQAQYDISRLALPGSMCGNESGGAPDAIPDMTYEALKDYHTRYYHPSNSISCLYGRFDDYAAFLKLLDDAFAPYEAAEITIADPGYTPITGPVKSETRFPVEATFDTRDASAICYAIVCPDLRENGDDLTALHTLTALMNASASNIVHAVQKALPRANFDFYFNVEGPDVIFLCTFQHVNPEDADTVVSLVRDGLKDIAENGFSREMMDSAMANIEISTRLAVDDPSAGVSTVTSLLSNYVNYGDPWTNLKYLDALKNMDRWNQDGTYKALIEKYLLNNDLTALSVTVPDPGAKEEKDAALAEHLKQVKASMSEAELDALVAASNAEPQENPDTDDMLRRLTAVTVQSLPEEVREYPLNDQTGEDGVRRIDVTSGLEGLNVADLLLDAAAMPQEDLHWMALYISLLGDLDTEKHDYETLTTLISRYLYSFSASLFIDGPEGEVHPRLSLSWLALDGDLQASYDLARELLLQTSFDNTQQLLDRVQARRTDLKSLFNRSPVSFVVTLALAGSLPRYRYLSYMNTVDYYDFLGEVERQLEDDPRAVAESLARVRDFFDNNAGLILAYCGTEAGIAANRTAADAFAASLQHIQRDPVEYDLPVPGGDSLALIVDSAVQYNGVALDLSAMGLDGEVYDPRIDVINKLIQDQYLLPQLRDQYGAYGAYVTTSSLGDGEYLYTYRDPNIAESFKVMDALPDFVEQLSVDQSTIDRYILSIYSDYAMPAGELSGALGQLEGHLMGTTPQDVLNEMRDLKTTTPETIAEFAEHYRAFIEKGCRFTAGGAVAINAHAELYDTILNPFGAADRTEQALSDVPEDSPCYEAVRYVFENGLMDAREDGSFGASDPATLADLSAALMAAIGQNADPAEATEALISYGILSPDSNPEEPVTADACNTALTGFCQALGIDAPSSLAPDADPFTRADLAQTLRDFAEYLNATSEAA